MAEKFPNHSQETQESSLTTPSESIEQRPSSAEQEHREEARTEEHIEQQRKHIEQHAKTIDDYKHDEAQEKGPQHEHPVLVNRQLKDAAFNRSLTRAQKKLSLPSKALSRVIHNPAVDAVSEGVGKTVARPSGLLGGATFALIGSSLLLWIARHYGYEYNYFAVFLLFIIGTIVGLFVEFLWGALKRKHSSRL